MKVVPLPLDTMGNATNNYQLKLNKSILTLKLGPSPVRLFQNDS